MTTKRSEKKAVFNDWHPADIVAALHKKGISLRQLALAHGYASSGALSGAMVRSYPKAEAIIAKALDMKPEQIWPSRYGDCIRRPYRGWATYRRAAALKQQHNSPETAGNAEVTDEV